MAIDDKSSRPPVPPDDPDEKGGLERERTVACELALEAGALVLAHYHAGVPVEFKGPDDPVTRADREASELIVAGLRKAFPDDGILSEELADSEDRLGRKRVWIIDPVDGTKEFIKKTGEFAIMIGLAIRGRPRVGVVYEPVPDRLYHGVTGAGARMVHQGTTTDVVVSERTGVAGLAMAVSRSHRSKSLDELGQALGVGRMVPSGSVGVKVGLVVRQECDLYVVTGDKTSEWDSCGPHAILAAAGGRMTDLNGRRLDYNRRAVGHRDGLVSTNGACHAEVLAAIARLRPEWKRRRKQHERAR